MGDSNRMQPRRLVGASLLMVGLLICQLAFVPLTHAEDKSVSIARDFEDNVTVTIDPAVMSQLQIKRQPGRMTIVVPDKAAAQGRLSVEPILEKAQLVNVQHRNNQKIITIESSQVFVGLKPAVTKSAASSPGGESPSKGKPPLRLSPRPAVPSDAQPVIGPVMGQRMAQTASPGLPLSSKPKILPSLDMPPEPAEAPAKVETPQRRSQRFVRRWIPSQVRRPQIRRVVGQPIAAPVSTMAVKAPPVVTEAPPQPEPLQSETAETTVAPSVVTTPPPSEKTLRARDFGVDEYDIPLNALAQQQHQASEASMGALWRVLGSLALVLALAVISLRYGLPWLFARYPFLAEIGRQTQNQLQNAATDKPKPMLAKTPRSKVSVRALRNTQAADPEAALPAPEAMRTTSASDTPVASPNASASQPSAMARAAIAGIAGTQDFNIVSYGKLGKEKELYLVEIGERQLVIATTPYSVSLITELDAAGTPVRQPAEPAEGQPDAKPATKLTPPLVALLGKVNRADAPPPVSSSASGYFRGRMQPVSVPRSSGEAATEERMADYEDIYPAG